MPAKNLTLAKGLARRAKAIADLEEDQPEIAEVVDYCFECNHGYIATYASQDTNGSIRILLLAQTIFEYLEDSFYLVSEGRLDQSAALCRMASEATRVLCRMSECPENEALFLDRDTRDKEYRKVFRFREDIPMEQALNQIYKLCSKYGVHGHFLTNVHLRPYDYFDGGKSVVVRIPDDVKYARILFWMRVYRIVSTLVVSALAQGKDHMQESRKLMDNFMISLDDLITVAEKNLKAEKED